MPKPFRYTIYARISKEEVGRKDHCADQIKTCQEWAEDAIADGKLPPGSVCVGVLEDPDVSISRRAKKPRRGWPKVLAQIKAGDTDAVLATEIERMYRQPKEGHELIELAYHGQPTSLLDVNGRRYNLNHLNDRADYQHHLVNAEREAELTSERRKRQTRRRATEGAWHRAGPFDPFGFEVVPQNGDQAPTLTVVGEEADAIRDGINCLLAGGSLGSIAGDWNRRGLRTRAGNLWTRGAVGRVLASARIAGWREHDGILHPASWDAIVERDVWEAAREVLRDPRRRFGRHPRGRVHELAGFIFCGRCGKPMIGYTDERGTRRYRCHPMLGCNRMGRRAEPVEELARNTMFEWLDSGAYDAAVANAASDPSRMRELSDRVQVLKKRLEQLQDKQILAQLADDGIEVQATKRLRAKTERELDEAVCRLREAQGESGLIDGDALRALRASWDKGDIDQHRRLYRALVGRVDVHATRTGNLPFDRKAVRVLPGAWARLSPAPLTISAAPEPPPPRLAKGALREQVWAYLADRPGQAISPTEIGKAVGRTTMALYRVLQRLTGEGKVVQTWADRNHPRYTIVEGRAAAA